MTSKRYVKPPERFFEAWHQDGYWTRYLFSLGYKERIDAILANEAQIDYSFLGFMDIYFLLSKTIPKHWTVVDFGCSNGIQSAFFAEHKEYIGVDASMGDEELGIKPPIFLEVGNSRYLRTSIAEAAPTLAKTLRVEQTFAICNYVPADHSPIRENFTNLYIFYPNGPSFPS